ncbi:Multimeric flavodoxin WrbA [Chitinophaga jiangningensis]|uniref:Multimeric flavodoxin WrbA n=1 Tax=Chitinophaga jiangningensis TaxID=1419482 RepID=A0A1M6YGH0_9BACT|nr:flavodoxin family protein [Chitinophaga jiangningensis]SHL17318.1 Multimeric flavodoxin WrbA [Chitinophaga jiangningensis]
MKALILLATLKKSGLSNTATLAEFFTERLSRHGVSVETIHLVNENILPGTYSDMGPGDAWPSILARLEAAQIIIFATPIWWGNHSSEIQKVIERLDNLHDEILQGKPSRLEGKVAGVIITGDSDGSQHIIGNISNFCNALGMLLPPYCSLAVQSKEQAKDKHPTKEMLMEIYNKDYSKTADTMVSQLLKYSGS